MSPTAKNDTREWLKIIIGATAVFGAFFYAGRVDQHVTDIDTRLNKVETFVYPTQREKNDAQADYIKHIKVK